MSVFKSEMASPAMHIRDPKFINWLKGRLAITFTKDGLEAFVANEIGLYQEELLKSVCEEKGLPPGTTCSSCSIQNILPCLTKHVCQRNIHGVCAFHDDHNDPSKRPNQPCPNNMCVDIKHKIQKQHRYNKPSFKNTDARLWCSDAFQIAKCYMPPDGYAGKNTWEECDLNAVISVMINNKRFEKRMKANLLQADNTCDKAREVSNKIRHSTDLSLSDEKLKEYIDTLQSLLSDEKCLCHDPKAQAAKKKIVELSSETLVISPGLVVGTIDDALRFQDNSEANRRALEEAKDSLLKCREDITVADLEKIFTDYTARLKKAGEDERKKIKKTGRKEREKLKRSSTDTFPTDPKRKKTHLVQELKVDIIHFYKRKKSTIPVAPSKETVDAPLLDFYVQPDLRRIFTNQYHKTSKPQQSHNQESPSKNPIKSFKELFLQGENETYKNIYITAKAGTGKTSFAQSVCMTWCQAHSPDEEYREKFKDREEDIETMKKFELLFFISLRCSTERNVDDVIDNQIISQLSRSYEKGDLEDILNDTKHLVILDGLDEWSSKNESQPYETNELRRRYRKTSTYLTTTRPWKLREIKQSEIDIQVEIDLLNEKTSDILLRNAVSRLSKDTRSTDDFKEKFPSKRLGVLQRIPYILLQLICLWLDGKSDGRTRNEIFCSAIELTFSHGHKKAGQLIGQYEMISKKFPECFDTFCPTFKNYYKLVLHLGKIAYARYFSDKRESTFVFDKTDVVPHDISDDALQDCIKVGILSQHEGEDLSREASKISYQHQAIQAFFAALYLESENEVELPRRIDSMSDMTEFLDVLLFLSGFSPVKAGRISDELQSVVDNDQITRHYRKFTSMYMNYNYRDYMDAMKSLQDMIIACAEESIANGHKHILLRLEDIFIDKNCQPAGDSGNENSYLSALKLLINNKKNGIKSLSIRECKPTEELTKVLETLNLDNFENLEKLEIWAVPTATNLNFLLSKSSGTLRSLNLRFVHFEKKNEKYSTENIIKYKIVHASRKHAVFGSESIAAIVDMKLLEAISLDNIYLTHEQLKDLLAYFKNNSNICEIELFSIKCTDHGTNCCGTSMDISQLKKLDVLGIGDIPLSELKVNCRHLKECWVGNLRETVFSSLLESLRNEAVMNLETLYFRDLKPNIVKDVAAAHLKLNLKRIGYAFTSFDDVPFEYCKEIKSLEFLCLRKVEMTSRVFKSLIDVIEKCLPNQSVAVTLRRCVIRPEDQFEIIKNEIVSSPGRFTVTFNGRDVGGDRVFSFRPVKIAA